MTRKLSKTQPHQSKSGKSANQGRLAKTIDDLTEQNIETIGALEAAAEAERSTTDRLADKITRFAGSMKFVYLHIAWFGAWVGCNSPAILPDSWRFDPFPFTFLTFVVSLEAIFLSTFILISQNHEERIAEKRNHLDLQINLLSEQENSKMLMMLEAIHQRLGIVDDDPEIGLLEESTRPDRLNEQIEEIIEKPRAN